MFSKVFLCLAAFSLTFSQVNKTDYFLRNCFLFSCLTLTESDKHLKMYLIAPLAFWGMFVQITVSMCTIQNHCTQTCAVRAGQWKMVPSHLAGVHAVRWGAPHPGPPRLPHLTAPTSVLAPPSQVRLIFASDRCPLTGKSRWEVRHLKMNVYKSKKKKSVTGYGSLHEVPYTCILSDCQQKATPVFAKRSQNVWRNGKTVWFLIFDIIRHYFRGKFYVSLCSFLASLNTI